MRFFMPDTYGIIGYPLTHSFSPDYFSEKFSRERIHARYRKFELESVHDFPALLQSYPDLKGLNVTLPHKTDVIPYLDLLDEDAAAIGAVNCIDIKQGKLKGYNTDVTGFEKSLIPLLRPQHSKALILGTGGGALAVAYVLRRLGIPYRFVSRNQKGNVITYAGLEKELIGTHTLIVNTTPAGMYPHTGACPSIPYEFLTPVHLLYDLIYNPAETKFLSQGKEQGAAAKNGLEMLCLQAEASWEIWNRV